MSSDNNKNNLEIGNYTLASFTVDMNGLIMYAPAYTPGNQCTINNLQDIKENPGYSCVLENEKLYETCFAEIEKTVYNKFLNWIECLKNPDENWLGVILMFRDQSEFVPFVLIKRLKKYGLLQRFVEVVKFFITNRPLVEDKCPSDMNDYLLGNLSCSVLGNYQLIPSDATGESLT